MFDGPEIIFFRSFLGRDYSVFHCRFFVGLMVGWPGVVGWLNYPLFGVFTASLVFIDQRLVARFKKP